MLILCLDTLESQVFFKISKANPHQLIVLLLPAQGAQYVGYTQ